MTVRNLIVPAVAPKGRAPGAVNGLLYSWVKVSVMPPPRSWAFAPARSRASLRRKTICCPPSMAAGAGKPLLGVPSVRSVSVKSKALNAAAVVPPCSVTVKVGVKDESSSCPSENWSVITRFWKAK